MLGMHHTSRYLMRLVPGMGKTSGPWACTHARASCPGVTPFLTASSFTLCTSAKLASRAPSWKRGCPSKRQSLLLQNPNHDHVEQICTDQTRNSARFSKRTALPCEILPTDQGRRRQLQFAEKLQGVCVRQTRLGNGRDGEMCC